jgi:2-amino-4-hydroxy-6-hydroxymethyldihydropteridine diphosphokinase
VTKALVAFGANLGDPAGMFEQVRRRLADLSGVAAVVASSLYRTVAVGGPAGQPAFMNGAFSLETVLDAESLFEGLRSIEADLGRRRTESWGPRTVDLDLALFGDRVRSSPTLATPHPRMHVRRFVLAPAVEVAPDAVHPLLGTTLAELHRSAIGLTAGETMLALIGDDPIERAEAAALFTERYPKGRIVGLPPGAVPGAAIVHAASIIGVRPSVHLPGVEDRSLERALDRVAEAAARRTLWIATTADFQPGQHPQGNVVAPTVDLRAERPAARRQEFLHFVESLAEPMNVERAT